MSGHTFLKGLSEARPAGPRRVQRLEGGFRSVGARKFETEFTGDPKIDLKSSIQNLFKLIIAPPRSGEMKEIAIVESQIGFKEATQQIKSRRDFIYPWLHIFERPDRRKFPGIFFLAL